MFFSFHIQINWLLYNIEIHWKNELNCEVFTNVKNKQKVSILENWFFFSKKPLNRNQSNSTIIKLTRLSDLMYGSAGTYFGSSSGLTCCWTQEISWLARKAWLGNRWFNLNLICAIAVIRLGSSLNIWEI